jgi:hypothetical protein
LKKLQWHEPAAYRRAIARRETRERPWAATRYAAFVFFVLTGLRAIIGWTRPNPNLLGWPWSLAVAAAAAYFFAFLFPWLITLLPNSIVILSEKGVNNNVIGHGVTVRFWSWDKIEYATETQVELDGHVYRTLVLHDANGRVLETFGLRDKPALDEISQFLNEQGKSLR